MWGSLIGIFDRVCTDYAERIALEHGDRSWTYAEMRSRATAVAAGLHELGVGRGQRVGLLMPNCPEYFPTEYGVFESGAAAVPISWRAGIDDIRYGFASTEVTTVIYHESFDETIQSIRDQLPHLRHAIRLGSGAADGTLDYDVVFGDRTATAPAIAFDPNSLALVQFTSGSTGEPKAVRQTHATLSHYFITAGMEVANSGFGERFLHVAPLTHFTQTFALPTFLRGGTNITVPALDMAGLLSTVQDKKVTATAVVPTILYMLLDHLQQIGPETVDLSSLRTIVYAGSPMAPDRLRRALDIFGPIFTQTYAGTEPGYLSCLRKEDHRLDAPELLSSAGRPFYHVDLAIRDEAGQDLPAGAVGEIWSHQAGQMAGYLDSTRDAEAIRDGWVRSGDLGYLDEHNYLYLVDRVKDMVVTGGFNVFPRQVEDVLSEHPAVALCAVFGIPDSRWGEAVKAVVVLRPDAEASEDELIQLVKQRKGGVWAPKSVEFAEVLPLTATGKVDKKSLRAPYWAGRQRQVH